jgi:hypothetical protein
MRVFVAGPMATSGEPGRNLHQAAIASSRLLELGHAPYVPHASWILDAIRPVTRERWLQCDREWLVYAEALLRLPGESIGADAECDFARTFGIPVFTSIRAFESHRVPEDV